MLKPSPTVQSWMTRNPRTVDRDVTLARAHEIMREEGIRHLPVLEGGKLTGILSQRDLHLIETLKDVDPERVLVHEAMTSHPYFVSPEAPLVDVVEEMSEHKFGAAVVMDDQRVVGMLTTMDALGAFAKMLRAEAELRPPAAQEGERPAGRQEEGADAGRGSSPAGSPRRATRPKGGGRGRDKPGNMA